MPMKVGYHKNVKYKKHYCHVKETKSNYSEITCKICGKKVKSVPGLSSHLLNAHCLNLDDYITEKFKNLTPSFKLHKCSFCERVAKPLIEYNVKDESYRMSYQDGYMCFDPECRDKICVKFFGKPYTDCIQKYEHIGANAEFLAMRYNLPIEHVKSKMKRRPGYKIPKESTTSLYGYIARYGEKLGQMKYDERCQKISKTMKIEWWIEKYGIVEGTRQYQARFTKVYNATKDITHSKNQYALFEKLKSLDSNWKDERYAGGCARVDMLNDKTGVVVEYFGDYWHCNPTVYKKDFYNKSIKKTAAEKWIADESRFQKIFLYSKKIELIIVIWEKSFMQLGLDKAFEKVQDKIKKHVKGKKEIIWI